MFQGMVGFTKVWFNSGLELPRERVIDELNAISNQLVKIHSEKLAVLSKDKNIKKSNRIK